MLIIKNRYKKFAFNIFSLLIILIFFDQTGGAVLRHFYFKQKSGSAYRTTYSVDSTTADILVFGSSRANHHYVPEIFEDSLKMSFYNTGRDGNFLIYNYAIFKLILKRYMPKLIIFEISPDDLFYDHDSYDRLSSLLPYYRNFPEIRPIVELKSPYEKIKLFSALYPYNSSLLTIGISNLELNKQRKSDDKGYVPLFNNIKNTQLIDFEKKDELLDSLKLKIINDIAQICKKNNIKLYFVQSPIYARVKNSEATEIISETALKYDSFFINFSNDPIFLNNPMLFQDIGHLNNNGAIVFSKLIAGIIFYQKKISSKKFD